LKQYHIYLFPSFCMIVIFTSALDPLLRQRA
jgi:hypothetical protein